MRNNSFRFGKIAAALAVASAAVLVLRFPSQTAQGTKYGLELCLQRVIPSVFPMMLVCLLTVECGYAGALGRLLAPAAGVLFGLPGEGAAAILLSMTGGYPAGAKAVAELYEKGAVTKQQAARMSLFCFCSGPAFLIGVVGGLTGSSLAGWLLMAVQTVVVTIMGVVICRIKKLPVPEKKSVVITNQTDVDLSSAIVSAVSKSASAMLQVCLYVIVFSAAGSLLSAAGISDAVQRLAGAVGAGKSLSAAIVPMLLEVTGGCVSAVSAGLPAVAFAVGFGGLSVQMQVLAITRRLGVDRKVFFAARCVQGAFSALLTAAALELLPETAITASTDFRPPAFSGSPQGAVMLVVMCAMCVLCLPHNDAADRGA